ncbi:zinc ribbon domain-containing protein, partial [candidate division KSB1 bacterium]
MSYCPQCGAEYRESAAFCPDCQQTLIPDDLSEIRGQNCLNCSTLNDPDAQYCWKCGGYLQAINLDTIPFSFQGEVMQCYSCGKDTPVGIEYCVQCGYLFTGAQSCHNRFICLICKKPVCRKCSRRVDGRHFCHEDSDYHIIGNWGIVYTSDFEDMMTQVRERLEEGQIYAIIGNQGSSTDIWGNGLFTENLKGKNEGRFQILVPLIQIKDAERLLVEADILHENICFNC